MGGKDGVHMEAGILEVFHHCHFASRAAVCWGAMPSGRPRRGKRENTDLKKRLARTLVCSRPTTQLYKAAAPAKVLKGHGMTMV